MVPRKHICLGSISTSTYLDFQKSALSLQLTCLGFLSLLLHHRHKLSRCHQSVHRDMFE
jgi:hypothetical protein